MIHSWAWSRGTHNLDRCKRIGCTAERIARENGSPRYLYRANATAAWSAKAPACGTAVVRAALDRLRVGRPLTPHEADRITDAESGVAAGERGHSTAEVIAAAREAGIR